MALKIEEINEKGVWENFLAEIGLTEKTFLHSWAWGEFQKSLGGKIWRWGIYDEPLKEGEEKSEREKKLIAIALVVKISARRGKFLLIPHGPIFKKSSFFIQENEEREKDLRGKAWLVLLERLRQIAKREKCLFVRIATLEERTEENKKFFKKLGLREAPLHIHPEVTWLLEIDQKEEDILKKMRKTTRYLIKQAEKNKDLVIEMSRNVKDVAVFNEVYQKTAARHHFAPFSFDYLEKEFLAFQPDDQILVFLAKYKGKILASAMIIFWQELAFYHQGASSQEEPKIPASYLLQWTAIKEAKRRGCSLYNFWGISPLENRFLFKRFKHPWAGLTLFKTGFGGYQKEYLKTQDLPLSFFYWFTFFFEKIRKIKRRL